MTYAVLLLTPHWMLNMLPEIGYLGILMSYKNSYMLPSLIKKSNEENTPDKVSILIKNRDTVYIQTGAYKGMWSSSFPKKCLLAVK